LRQLSRRDHIERISWHPLNLLQGLLGGHLYYCARCRLQFYDWRHLSREKHPSSAVYDPVSQS
jgi:hypothetical protein